MKKTILLILSVLLLLALWIPLKLFLIGEPVDGELLHHTITEDGNGLHLDVSTSASAIAFHGWKYHQEGSILYISARKVLASPVFCSGSYETTIDTTLLSEIYLGGMPIWPL